MHAPSEAADAHRARLLRPGCFFARAPSLLQALLATSEEPEPERAPATASSSVTPNLRLMAPSGTPSLRVSRPFLVHHVTHVEADRWSILGARGLPEGWRAQALAATCRQGARKAADMLTGLAAATIFDVGFEIALPVVSNGLVVSPAVFNASCNGAVCTLLCTILKLIVLQTPAWALWLAQSALALAQRTTEAQPRVLTISRSAAKRAIQTALVCTKRDTLTREHIRPFAVKHVAHVDAAADHDALDALSRHADALCAHSLVLQRHAGVRRGEISPPFNVQHRLHVDARFQVSDSEQAVILESPVWKRSALRPLAP